MNKRQRDFVEHYMQTRNATEAAILAGYSEKTAYSMGSRLLKNDEIIELLNERLNELTMSTDEILKRMTAIAKGEKPSKWTQLGPDEKNKVDTFEPMVALDKLAKIRGMYTTRQEIDVNMREPMTWKETIEAARADDDEK